MDDETKEDPVEHDKYLNGFDYMTKPLTDIAPHPTYSSKAMITILAISVMNTNQLEALQDLLTQNEKDI